MKSKYFFGIVMLALFVCVSICGCTEGAEAGAAGNIVLRETTPAPVAKIEVFHFHGARQCYSCKTVGDYAEETVKTYFQMNSKQEELFSGISISNFLKTRSLPRNTG